MQNNVTELTQKLLRSLDSNYNVTNMPAVIEIISQLEKVAITKELLETTRLGKYINELRRKTTNDSLSKRAKELVKKWRNAVFSEPNGQIKKTASPVHQNVQTTNQEDVKFNKKRPGVTENLNNAKRVKVNGGVSELEFSDNSNSSFKDVIKRENTIIANSDSNSSEKHDPALEQQMPKKRGRKKGSKNHKNLLEEAESSFTSKLAVSRGNSKVKTTEELIASLRNKNINSMLKPKEDLMEKAAKLTERVSIIDQQLNSTNRLKGVQKNKLKPEKIERVIESGSVINDKSLLQSNVEEEVEIIEIIDEEDAGEVKIDKESEETENNNLNVVTSLSVEEALELLPSIDKSVLIENENDEPKCTCSLEEVKEENNDDSTLKFEFVQDQNCQAKKFLTEKYKLDKINMDRVNSLHLHCIPNMNGNISLGEPTYKCNNLINDNDGLYENVVPNMNDESVKKDFKGESFDRYSFSENCEKRTDLDDKDDDNERKCFKEWHEVVETPSYNGEVLKILPYVIID